MDRTVLVVDDDQQIRELLQIILQRNHCHVYPASDGATAIDWMKGHRGVADLVLVNASMPMMPGYEASHEMKRLCPETPIILMSGYARQHFDGIDGALRDIDGFLKKPFRIDELYELVEGVGRSVRH